MRKRFYGQDNFGGLLRYYRRKSRDTVNGGPLSQERLADLLSLTGGIIYSRGAISGGERGKGHIHRTRAIYWLACYVCWLRLGDSIGAGG